MSQPFIDACTVEVRDQLDLVPAAQWNALASYGNPFLKYEFLHALEATGCLGERNGWFPRYFLVYHESTLIAACPTYVKTNSYGEFVFDWAWAEAYQNNGLEYYPKLVSCIPYTPCTGNRFLLHPEYDSKILILSLVKTIINFSNEQHYSSVHWLFVTKHEIDILESAKLLTRKDCQYHWQNKNYPDFETFLASCTSRRRKTIRRERRYVRDANIALVRRSGGSLTAEEWRFVHQFYCSTFDRKWGSPSLTEAFFRQLGETMGDNILIVFAYHEHDMERSLPIACSIMFIGETTLYGRFWGCNEQHHSLHFEACYYQGIEFCIEQNLATFEPGAQGEHKISRGFEPTLTYSSHWILHDGFRDAIAHYLKQETNHVQQRCEALTNLLPFKHRVDIADNNCEDPAN